jgi:hypothetical protein
MFLHIGGDVSVPIDKIICIVNCKTSGFGTDNVDGPQSAVFSEDSVYKSDISALTLSLRMRKLIKFIQPEEGGAENV